MENKMFQEIADPIERERTLAQLCRAVQEEDYQRFFSDEEQSELNAEFVRQSVSFAKESERTKAEVKALNDGLRDKGKEVTSLLKKVQTGCEDINGKVYLFDDQANNKMGVYDPAGNLLYERTLKPTEKQLHISSNSAQAM